MFSGKKRLSHDFTTDGVAGNYVLSSERNIDVNIDKKTATKPVNKAEKYDKPLAYIKENSIKEYKRYSLQNEVVVRSPPQLNTSNIGKFPKKEIDITRRDRLSSLDGLPCKSSTNNDATTKTTNIKRSKSLKKRLSLRLIDFQTSFERKTPEKKQENPKNAGETLPNTQEIPNSNKNTPQNEEKERFQLEKVIAEDTLDTTSTIDTLSLNSSSLLEEILAETSVMNLSVATIKEEPEQIIPDMMDLQNQNQAEEKDTEEIFKKCKIRKG